MGERRKNLSSGREKKIPAEKKIMCIFTDFFKIVQTLCSKYYFNCLPKVIDVSQWDSPLLSLNVLMNTKLVSWQKKPGKSACWSQITLNLTTKFSRARPPGEFPLSFTFFSLVDFENGLKFTSSAKLGPAAAASIQLMFVLSFSQ